MDLLIDITDPGSGTILRSLRSEATRSPGAAFKWDQRRVRLFFARRTADNVADRVWDSLQDVAIGDAWLGIGERDEPPASGTWTIIRGAAETDPLAFDATEAAVEAAILATFSEAVTVTRFAAGQYKIAWDADGVRDLFTIGAESLIPESNGTAYRITEGDASTAEEQFVELIRRPFIFIDTWSLTPARGSETETLDADPGTFAIALTPQPYTGSFRLQFEDNAAAVQISASIGHDASAAEVLDALPGANANWSVIKTGASTWVVSRQIAGAWSLTSVLLDDLVVMRGLSGELRVDAIALLEAFASIEGNSFTSTLEVKLFDQAEGARSTVLQVPVSISRSVLTLGSIGPRRLPEYLTAAQTRATRLNFDGAVDNYTVGANALSTVPTVDLEAGYMIAFIADDGLQVYQLLAGTENNPPIQIRPDDYHATENQKYWQARI